MRGAGVTEISSLEFKGQTRSMQDTVPEGQRLLTALLAASDIAYAWNVRSGAIEWLSDPTVLGAQFASIRNADSLAARIHAEDTPLPGAKRKLDALAQRWASQRPGASTATVGPRLLGDAAAGRWQGAPNRGSMTP